jgi:hypothetical protein
MGVERKRLIYMTSVVAAQLILRNSADRMHVRIKYTYGLVVQSCGLTLNHCTSAHLHTSIQSNGTGLKGKRNSHLNI